ncbi:hypothetical protein MSP7336_00043 [Mycobacterium shimoidei]|uniref:Uncharacterized protein n=1 Tax=Mycobacterium shimoidei TaxID=29313 RepID=A0A375YSL6_MYCSH|nr:hypothetical protein MSP7336_00043 [Mycobacterium shimoidei]
MLTLQNHDSLNNLRVIGSLNSSLTGSLPARVWDTVRGLVQAVARTQAQCSEDVAADQGSQPNDADAAPRILARGLERC